jgi:hypothetical protein
MVLDVSIPDAGAVRGAVGLNHQGNRRSLRQDLSGHAAAGGSTAAPARPPTSSPTKPGQIGDRSSRNTARFRRSQLSYNQKLSRPTPGAMCCKGAFVAYLAR